MLNPTQVLRTILNNQLLIDFTQPVTAFGLDFIYNSGVTQTAHVDILAADDTTVLQTHNFGSFSGANGQAFFFGVTEPGIGAVRITETLDGTTNPFFITVDNVSFAAVPEPSTGLLLATGLGGVVVWLKRNRIFTGTSVSAGFALTQTRVASNPRRRVSASNRFGGSPIGSSARSNVPQCIAKNCSAWMSEKICRACSGVLWTNFIM